MGIGLDVARCAKAASDGVFLFWQAERVRRDPNCFGAEGGNPSAECLKYPSHPSASPPTVLVLSEARLAGLYREREIARASAVQRDPNAMLN
jgi:hypothetical protein